ncbi:MAG: hypothetical protein MUE40_11520 [Anaerolineae bacterium]|jgi:hypothetical protein|nr:hypothetical protein [Anaerolineae bacterium]
MSQPAAPKTLRDHLRALGGALLLVAVTFALIEAGLRVIDPWGLRYFEDLAQMGNVIFTPDDRRGYIMPDGTYQFSHWSATVQDGGRVLPATNPAAACEIVLLGDSVGFGYGVNDADTWANGVARALPQLHLRNLSVPRYNSTNVLGMYRTVPDAAAYLYLIINNDVAAAIDVTTQRFGGAGEGLPWLVRYMNFALYRGGGTDRDENAPPTTDTLPDTPAVQRFFDELAQLTADPRVYLAAFSGEALTSTILARGYPLTVLDYPRQRRISLADYHLNPQGNAELAAQMQPLIERIAAAACPPAP